MNFYNLDFDYNRRNIQLIVNYPFYESMIFSSFMNSEYVTYNDTGPSNMTLDRNINDELVLKYNFTKEDGTSINIHKHYNSNISMSLFIRICKWENMSPKDKFDYYKTYRDQFNHLVTKHERNFEGYFK